jgi:hypothetical protein
MKTSNGFSRFPKQKSQCNTDRHRPTSLLTSGLTAEILFSDIGRHGNVLASIQLQWLTSKIWVNSLEFLFYLSCRPCYNYFRFEGHAPFVCRCLTTSCCIGTDFIKMADPEILGKTVGISHLFVL